MRDELFAMTTALATVFKELGEMLEQAGVMPLETYSEKFTAMAVNSQESGEDQSRYLAIWAYTLLDTVRNRPSEPSLN
ncbi:hypothetical protein [Sphingobium sp. YR768]|uniref:hypothetical protein n=1 Tax=Sphingobium sp. YR768 TaxID=1884365 RepID=UPI0008CCF445|nr:hypothetical protein [Sphingobium sp. YR768]SER22726.1 hypothetical protein SAMN05518866_1077 [Sphingobium sp. YR768]